MFLSKLGNKVEGKDPNLLYQSIISFKEFSTVEIIQRTNLKLHNHLQRHIGHTVKIIMNILVEIRK
jgi:uncharacterized protein YaaN involved in tellurite resistance